VASLEAFLMFPSLSGMVLRGSTGRPRRTGIVISLCCHSLTGIPYATLRRRNQAGFSWSRGHAVGQIAHEWVRRRNAQNVAPVGGVRPVAMVWNPSTPGWLGSTDLLLGGHAMHAARLSALAAALGLAALPATGGEKAAALPRGFRSWTHVRSMVVTDADEGMYGFHNVYANPAALKALRAKGKPAFPEGAQFVVSIFEVKHEKGLVVAGPKQRDVVQVKDRSARATGGWRYASFDPAGNPIAIDASSCSGCHAHAAETDMVFTRYTE
jgi:hypothetical protein